jgi:outer membrane protein assembly factor BamB
MSGLMARNQRDWAGFVYLSEASPAYFFGNLTSMRRLLTPTTFLAVLLIVMGSRALADDWPMSGADAQHSGSIAQRLPANLEYHWSLDLPALAPAWPDQNRLKDDAIYHPIVVDGRVIIASPLDDSIAAYDVADGKLLWRFFTQGPMRVTPAADDQGRIFAGSDDGYLYALDAGTGRVIWKFKAAPRTRPILGNGRMIDTWAVRGGPVVADGKVYFAGGVWPFMGIFLHCLDAKTGDVIWTSSGDGADFLVQPHGDPSFGGPAPQGSIAVIGDKLVVPNGRSVPAVYERATGKLRQLNLAYKYGGDRVSVTKKYYLAGDVVFKISDGKPAMFIPPGAAIVDDVAYAATREGIATFQLDTISAEGPKKTLSMPKVCSLTTAMTPGGSTIIRAGNSLYVGGAGFVAAADLPLNPESPDPSWKTGVDGIVVDLVAASDCLFAMTDGGRLYCFGSGPATNDSTKPGALVASSSSSPQTIETKPASAENDWISHLPDRAGYCLAIGRGTESLVRELIDRTSLQIVMLEADPQIAHELRQRFHRDNLYGRRVAVMVGDITGANLPPYFASVVIATDSSAYADKPNWCETIHHVLNPYSGVAFVAGSAGLEGRLEQFIDQNCPKNAAVTAAGDWYKFTRFGGPPGAANWTHEHADASNTRVSKDSLVKAPLGILWFGGTSNDNNLPRHGHGPGPQVCDGRLFLETIDAIRASDIYTGRVLWETPMPGVGSFFNNTQHQAGANGTGSNFVSIADGVYVATERSCVWLDPVSGAKRAEFPLPRELNPAADALWGYINVDGDFLIGGIATRIKSAKAAAKSQLFIDPFEDSNHVPEKPVITNTRSTASHVLFVLDRHTGKLLWSTKASKEYRHNAVCTGGGKLFAIDLDAGTPTILRIGKSITGRPMGTVQAFDLATGNEVWHSNDHVFGTFTSYSEQYDVLMESGRRAADTLKDEPVGMRAYRASTGEVLWYDEKATGPAIICGGKVMKTGSADDLITGQPITRDDPITGALSEWAWNRLHGCNTPIFSPNLITFRSGAAGFYDLARCGGTGNFGGFRSGCTNNLIIAGGILSAPDYSRTCTCSYQMQTSLAMVSDPDAEEWTFAGFSPHLQGKIKRVGINLGAPGDRVDDSGTTWLEYPSVGGKSPNLKISVSGDQTSYYRRHASSVSGAMPWITASGVKNVRNFTIGVDTPGSEAHPYTVRLYFAQPAQLKPSSFAVSLQGQVVEAKLDVMALAGGVDRTLVREYSMIEAGEQLSIDLKPLTKGGTTILSGVEIIAEQ